MEGRGAMYTIWACRLVCAGSSLTFPYQRFGIRSLSQSWWSHPSVSNWLVTRKHSGMGLGTLRKVLFIHKGMSGFSFSPHGRTAITLAVRRCGAGSCLVVMRAAGLGNTSWIAEQRQGKDLGRRWCNQAAELTRSDRPVCQDSGYMHSEKFQIV